jgi:RimJ/RimL family protein N-acetyltransferase
MRVPRLEDGVVSLDAHTLADVTAQVAGEDPEQARRFGWHPKRSTPATVTAAIEAWQAQWAAGGPKRAFAVRELAGGALAGGCELRMESDGRATMSYWIFPPFRGLGLATRAVRLATAWAFAELDMGRVELHIEADNDASHAVARRAGFSREGVLRDHTSVGGRRADMVSWSRLPSDPDPTAQEARR